MSGRRSGGRGGRRGSSGRRGTTEVVPKSTRILLCDLTNFLVPAPAGTLGRILSTSFTINSCEALKSSTGIAAMAARRRLFFSSISFNDGT